MASQKRPGVATMSVWLSAHIQNLMIFTGLLALLLSPFGVYSISALRHYGRHLSKARTRTPINASLVGGRRRRRFITCRVFWRFDNRARCRPAGWPGCKCWLVWRCGTIGGSLYRTLTKVSVTPGSYHAFLVASKGWLTLMGIGSAAFLGVKVSLAG